MRAAAAERCGEKEADLRRVKAELEASDRAFEDESAVLKAKSEQLGVAQKLIATSAELDEIAAGMRQGAALKGWRRKAFGEDALRLCDGELALRANGQNVEIFEV